MDSGRLETLHGGAVHLDTVRALHQTVVALRTALEVSKNELKELKQKYQQHSQCINYADVIEKLTLENHILRRKIIDTDYVEKDSSGQNIKFEVTYSPRLRKEDYSGSEIVIRTATTDVHTEDIGKIEPETQQEDNYQTVEDNIESSRIASPEDKLSTEIISTESSHNENSENVSPENTDLDVQSQISSAQEPETKFPTSFQTKLELLSKFDVRIKVRTLKEGSIVSTTTSDTDSSDNKTEHFQEKTEQHNFDINESVIKFKSVSSENIKMAVPNEAEAKSKTDKFDVKVRITSEENLLVKDDVERGNCKETLNLDVDDLSVRSLSEGDNSVFSEGAPTPVDHHPGERDGNTSGNDSEEVDDIELIFTTDESKDMSNLQEDLVPIRESDHWTPTSASTHSTPVLIKFHTLDPDFHPGETTENQENKQSLRSKRVSLPNDKEIKQVIFNKGLEPRGILKSCDNKSDNMLNKRSQNASYGRLNSSDSLTCDYNRLSFDNKSSSFEIGSSSDVLTREESVDSFYKNCHLGHRFSVFAETDISKCGISEDDLAGNLNVRRNTCPNPFQYRPPYRVSRPPGPFFPKHEARGGRRDSAAQTTMTALPDWGSDGYLAYKSSVPRCAAPPAPRVTSRRGTYVEPTSGGARRVMLSDIGFTSMVPELSRSADPVWAMGKLADTGSTSNSTSKFLSRGSSYRSPSLSVGRSCDALPAAAPPHTTAEYRRWRCSLPDVRDAALQDAHVRRSIDNLHAAADVEKPYEQVATLGQPYIPSEPRQLRLGHTVKLITPQGRLAVGRVRYVGLAGGTAATSSVVVGAEFPLLQNQSLPRNDGTYKGRRYFLTPPQFVALFVPFNKVVMAWTN